MVRQPFCGLRHDRARPWLKGLLASVDDAKIDLTGAGRQMQGATLQAMNPRDEIPKRVKLPNSLRLKRVYVIFADLIEACGHVPGFKAVHMNAPSSRAKSVENPLAPRTVPHMSLTRLE